MGRINLLLHLVFISFLLGRCHSQIERRVGKLQEVFAWKQLTYNINGRMVLQDRFGDDDLGSDDDGGDDDDVNRFKRQSDRVVFNNTDEEEPRSWNIRPNSNRGNLNNFGQNNNNFGQNNNNFGQNNNNFGQNNNNFGQNNNNRPNGNQRPTPRSTTSTTSRSNSEESSRFFTQYNNVPMGVERVGNRVFVTVPRRRYGIPSTLNYLDLNTDSNNRSPGLRPYPNLRQASRLTSIYRTKADSCGRLWAVDTGMLEIPNNRQQIQPPAIVVFDLNRNRQIMRYPFKSSDLVNENTPAGFASITIDIENNDCANAYAYVPDLSTYGLIVYSLRDNDSWRLSHNYFSFNPTAGSLNIAGQRFQWNDGIFSVALGDPTNNGCRVAYFHPMASTQEFSVSTCLLKNRTASQDSSSWSQFNIVGDRGVNSQSNMHDYHPPTKVLLFANLGQNAITCWNTADRLTPSSVAILAQDSQRLSYPSDLHITGDEVWIMANTMPRFIYARLDTEEYNFYIYRASVQELIAGSVCDPNGLSSLG